jgi:RNA polymerase sigma factor (sigma-70 family)
VGLGRADGTARDMATLFGLGAAGSFSDAQLLEQFAQGVLPGSEQAFAALVERHGRMVLATCRSVLRDEHAALDTCQATFLVLARKARTLRAHGSLGPWLHLVAMRAARSAGSASRRRRFHEAVAAGRNRERADPADALGPDAGAVHEEIGRLPERYRGPIVLCELEGHPLEHAARSLGCPVGTVKSRLSRGRLILRDRLAGRGLDPSRAIGVAVGLGRVAVPADMVAKLARTAELVRAGLGLASGLVPAAAIESASLVLGSFSMITMKTTLMAAVTAAMVTAGAIAGPGQEDQPGDGTRPATLSEVHRIESRLDEIAARLRKLEELAPAKQVVEVPPQPAPKPAIAPPPVDAAEEERKLMLDANDRAAAKQPRADSVRATAVDNITIDGDLADWPVAIPRYPISNLFLDDPKNTTGPGGLEKVDPSNNPDLSAAFSAAYDPEQQLLYLAVIIRDDRLIVGNTSHLDTDAVEVYVDGLHSTRSIPWPGDEAVVKLRLPQQPVQQYVAIPGPGPVYGTPQPTNPILIGGDLEKTRTKMAYRRVGDVTTYEWAIQPFDTYPDRPTKLVPGKRIGFAISVADKDVAASSPMALNEPREDKPAWVYWGPKWNGMKVLDAGALGEIVLGK